MQDRQKKLIGSMTDRINKLLDGPSLKEQKFNIKEEKRKGRLKSHYK